MMDRVIVLVFIDLLFFSFSVSADSDTSIKFSVGHRSDDVSFNIAGDLNGNNPNILSELSWTGLKIVQKKISLNHHTDRGAVLIASAAYGFIDSGANQDSDFIGDNRTLEFSRSNNNASGDDVVDLEIGFGYQFDIYDSKSKKIARVSPLLGFSYHEQNLRMTDGFQTLSRPSLVPSLSLPSEGPITGLNSTYRAEWKGIWFGAQFWFEDESGEDGFYFLFKHHRPDFNAEADWNLRPDFAHPKSFEHNASGMGNEFLIERVGTISEVWSFTLALNIQQWQTSKGVDLVYFSDGTLAATRLNSVEWKSTAFMFGLKCRI